jgi:RNA polymerase sigma-70 factor, ECF subfamily
MRSVRPRLQLVPPSMDPDDDLMLRARSGDRAAFAGLIDRYEASIRRFAQTIVKNPHAARDATQDTFLKVWDRRESYRAQGQFKSFLFRVALTVCLGMERKRRVRAFIGLDEDLSDPRPTAYEELEHAELESVVLRALHELPARFRTPLVLRFVEGMDYEEIARVIGRTPSATRSRVFYGLRELRARLPEEVFR